MSEHVDKKIQPLTPESKKWIVEGISEGINIKQMNDLKEKSKDLKQLGEVAMDAKEQTDQLAESLERVDGKEVNVSIKTSTETEDNSQLKGIRNSIDKKYVEQKRIDLNQLASKWKSEQSKEQDADKKIDLLVKAQTAEKLKTSSTDQIKANDIKAIIESAAEGNQQLIDQANKMYGSSENYSAFKGKVIEVISDGLQKINTKVDESFIEMSDVLNTAISQYKKNNDLTSATNVMKIVNQILAKNSKYDFTTDQKKTFEDIGKNNAYSRYIYGQDSEGNSGKLSDAYKILLDKTKSSDERMDQLIEVAKTMSGISSAFDRYNLANLKGDANVNQALAKTFRDLTNGRTGVTTVTALKDVIIEPSNSAKLNQNQTVIKNLIDVFKGSGARTPNPEYGEIVKSLIEYVNNNTTDNTFDYDITKAKGKLTLKRNKSGNSDEKDSKEMDKQRKSLEKERNEIENKYLKQLNKTSSAGSYMHQYDQLMAAVKAYRQNADEFSQKFGQEIYRFPEFPESYNEDTLETMTNSLAEIFELIEKYNDLVSYAQSNGGDPQNARSIFQSVSETFTQLTNVVSEFEKSYGLKFKSSESIQVYAGKYQKLNDGFTSELTSKTKGFINENIQISDKRIEIQKLSEDIINFQEELAPLVAKLKPAIDTEGAEVNKSDLDAFTELVDKIKTAGETISGMNMREAMKSKLGTKAQSKLNGVQTWEEYIETLNTRTIIDDTGEKDEKKSGDGEGNGSGDGSGSGASLEEIQKALEPVEGKITEVKNAVEQLDTDLGNKLDTINRTIENNKPDVNLDVDSVYDKFRDDVVAIRTGVEKVASNFDQGENPSSTKKTEVITEYLANLLTDSNEIYMPVDYKKEASLFNKGQNEARKVINELESKYNNNEELLKQIDDHLMDYISNKVDLSGINESFDIVPAQGYVEYMTNYMKTQDNEKYFKNSRFNTERVNVNDDLMSDIFNNSFIEEAQSTGRWISDFETSLNRAEQIIKELTKPHSLPMIIESLEDLKRIISYDYFGPSDYIRVGGREFNYLSPVTGKSQSIYFDQEERSDSQASGYPSFIEFIDKDLNFLKNLLDAKNANKESTNIENTQDSRTVNQILTDAKSKLENIVNYLGESKKSDIEIDVDGIYDKFKDDIIAIRKGIEKVANNFDETTEVQTQDSVKIPEYLSKLIDESAGYGYVPTVSREHTNEIREQGYSIGLQIIDEIEKSLMSNIEGSNIASIMRNLQFNEKDSSTNATYSYDPNFVKSILEIITKLAAQSKNQAVSIDQITKELAVPEKGYAHGGQILYKQADAMLALETVQDMNNSSGSENNTFDLSFAQQIFENLASFFDQYGEMFDSLANNDDLSEAKQDEAQEISDRLVDAGNKIADQLKISRTQKSEDGEIYSNEEIQNNLINVAKEVYDDLEDLSMSIEQYKTFTGNDKKIQDSKYVIQSIIKDIQNDVISKIVSDNGIQTLQSGKIIEYDGTGDTKKKNIQVTVDKSQINEIIKILDRSIGSAWREEGNYGKMLSEIDKYIIANRPSDEQSPAEWLKFSGIRGSLIGAQDKIDSDYGDFDSQYRQYQMDDTTKISSQNKLFNAIAKNFDNLSDAQRNMEQLSNPHKLKDILSYLTRIRNVIDAMYFGNDAAEFVNDKYSLKYVSPINGSSTQYEFDATKDRTSPESGLPQFLEAVDSDIKFLTELSEQIKDKPDVKEPIVEKKSVNTMLSELIAQVEKLARNISQEDNTTIDNTSIAELINSNTIALDNNTAALKKLSNEGLNLSQDNVSVETEDVLAQIQEIRQTLQSTQTATEAAGFKDIADTINNQVIPQIQKKNDNIIAEKKLVDKTVTAEINRFTELANTIKNKVGEAITAKNTLLENDLNNTKAIVDQQMEYVRQLVDSIRDMFAMADNPEDMTKANALILEFKATENLTDNYRKEVANTLVELDKLWNTGKIEEYQNKFIELMHILESHQKQQKTNVNKDELAYLKEEAQQIKDVLGYTRGVKGQKTPTLISKEMIDSLGSSVDLLNQIYGAKGKGWRQAQEHEKGITWQDLRFMDAEDKRYTGATIVNDQDMEDAEFFMTYATKLLDTLEKIKNLSVETEIGGMLGNEQYYAQATNELENRLNSVVGKNYNAFPNPVENDALEGFEEVITDAEAQQKAADELEQRLTANGAQTTIVQMIDLLSTKMSELKKYIDGIANETTSVMFANLASDIGAIYQAITLIPEGGMPDLLGSNKDNVSKLANLQSSIQSIYASITNNQQVTMDAPLSNLNVTLSPEGANQLTTQIANAIAAGEYTIKKFKVADDTRVASKIQAVINKEEPIVVSQFEIMPQKSLNFSNKLSQLITESGNISLKKFDVVPENIDKVRQDIETKLNEKPIKLNNWEAGNFKRINNLVAEGVAKSISDDIQKGLDEKKLILKNWEIKGIQAKINEALKQSPVTVEDFKVGNLANAKQDIAKKIGATKITLDENNPIDIDALNVKTITISDEVAQKIKPIPVTVNPTNLDELVTQITDAFEVGTSKVIKLPNQAAYNTQKTNIAELVGEFETVIKSAQDYAEAIYSITDAIKSVFEQSKPMLNEINASVNNMLNGLHLLNGTNQQESKSNTELYYEDLIKNAKNAQMRMQAGNTSVRGEAYISAMNDEYTKLISLLEQAKDGEGEFDSKLASDIKEQRTVISEMENSFKELEKTANEAEKKLAAAEARIAQAAADNLESPYTEEENQLLQDLRDMIARARSNVSQGTSGEINSALREALEMVYENVNTDGLDQSMLDRLREPVVVDYSDPEKYVKAYAESGLKVKEQLEDANSNLVKALTETQRDDLSKKYYDFAELLQKIVNGDVELNADTDKEVSAAYKEIMDAFNKSIGKSSTQQNQKQKVIDVNLLNKYKKELEKYNNQLAKYHDGTAVKYQDKINSYSPEIDRIIEGSKNITDDTSPEAVALKQSYDELIQNIKTMKDGSEGGSGGLTKYLDTKKSAAEIDRLNKKFDELIAKIQVYVKNNSKLTTDPEVKTQFQALLSDAQSATRSAAEYDRLNASLSQLKATVSNKGLTGRSLGDDIKYIAERIGIKAALSNSIYKVIGYFRQMVTTVTELDTGMTALKRVTQETQRVYTDFLKSTTQNAQALGATMSEVVDATTSFSKLGYNLQEAQTLANNAIIYKTVGDIDINTATNDMISTMKAFNMEASQSEHIVDAFDIINNKYAVSAQQVGEGLRNSASALATANNTFEESAAMVTAITEITQDQSSAGSALKTLSMRLRGN